MDANCSVKEANILSIGTQSIGKHLQFQGTLRLWINWREKFVKIWEFLKLGGGNK